MQYNHDRPVSDFKKEIFLIKAGGFKLIAVSQIYFEDTFVFETQEEADRAYKTFEDCGNKKLSRIVGWWYGKEDFIKEVETYEKENNGYSKVLVHWLD
jgi:hypothetical protein